MCLILRTKRSINREKYSGQGCEEGVTGNEVIDSSKAGNSHNIYSGRHSPQGSNHSYNVSGNHLYLNGNDREEFHDVMMSKSRGSALNGGDK